MVSYRLLSHRSVTTIGAHAHRQIHRQGHSRLSTLRCEDPEVLCELAGDDGYGSEVCGFGGFSEKPIS